MVPQTSESAVPQVFNLPVPVHWQTESLRYNWSWPVGPDYAGGR